MYLPKVRTWPLLLPFAWLYGLGVWLRNRMFDIGWLRSTSFEGRVPVICIGNIAAGGTGKTPHVEYIVRLLQAQNIGPVAVLSRGYKRKSRGFVLATEGIEPARLGDEPYQMHRKFRDLIVAVDTRRENGIRRLLALDTPPRVILLDDAFQHRYVRAGLSICLTSYSRILYKDLLLPAGRLREPAKGIRRADLVVVTKCPARGLRDEEQVEVNGSLPTRLDQPIYTTAYRYGRLVSLLTNKPTDIDRKSLVLMLTAIADPSVMEQYVQTQYRLMDKMAFSDHHHFTAKDIAKIRRRLAAINEGGNCPMGEKTAALADNAVIITTEKDAARLIRHTALDDELKARIYMLPTEAYFYDKKQEQTFHQTIIDYVTENTANR